MPTPTSLTSRMSHGTEISVAHRAEGAQLQHDGVKYFELRNFAQAEALCVVSTIRDGKKCDGIPGLNLNSLNVLRGENREQGQTRM